MAVIHTASRLCSMELSCAGSASSQRSGRNSWMSAPQMVGSLWITQALTPTTVWKWKAVLASQEVGSWVLDGVTYAWWEESACQLCSAFGDNSGKHLAYSRMQAKCLFDGRL